MFDSSLADMIGDEPRMMVGQVVTFNGLADYIAAHDERNAVHDRSGRRVDLNGQVGFVCEYQERCYDDGDPENGPHLAIDAWFDVYVPALGRSIQSDPNEWGGVVAFDWIETA